MIPYLEIRLKMHVELEDREWIVFTHQVSWELSRHASLLSSPLRPPMRRQWVAVGPPSVSSSPTFQLDWIAGAE